MSKYLQKRQQVHLNACLKFPCLAIGYSCPHVLLTQRRRQVDQMAITTSSQKTHPGKGLRQSGPSPPTPFTTMLMMTTIWALASCQRVCLLYNNEWLVISDEFYFKLLPDQKPWLDLPTNDGKQFICINVRKILAVKVATYAVAKKKAWKNSGLLGSEP